MSQVAKVKLAWWITLIFVCTHFCLAYFQNDKPFLNLDQYVHGKALNPYQSRILMAWILRLGLRIPHLASVSSHIPFSRGEPSMLILFAISWITVVGSCLFSWRSLTLLTQDENYSRWASLLVVYMAYFQFPLVFGLDFLLPYDLPSLFLFCGCVYGIISGRMWAYYLCFIIGSFNRETICMVAFFFAIWRWHEGKGQPSMTALAGHIMLQIVLWLAIRMYVHHMFANNPAEAGSNHFYYKLKYNLHEIINPQQWPVIGSIFGFTLPLVLIWRRWMKNPALEQGIYLMALWLLIMMLVGVIVEIRIFSEMISYMVLALGLIIYNKFFLLRQSEAEVVVTGQLDLTGRVRE